ERAELCELVSFELTLLVAADKYLEHDAAVDVEENDQRGELAHEAALQEIEPAAALVPQMAMEALRGHQVEIAAADLAARDRPAEREGGVGGVNDQRDVAPGRDVLHGSDERVGRREAPHLGRQRLHDLARCGGVKLGGFLDDRPGILRQIADELRLCWFRFG